MSSVVNVLSVTSPYKTRLAYPVVNPSGAVQMAQDVKNIGNALQSGNLKSAQKVLGTIQQNIPMSLLLSASQPAKTNSLASTDYQELKSALVSGNLTVAQQAYIRLQSDLAMVHSIPAASTNSATDSSSVSAVASTASQAASVPGPATSSGAGSPVGSLLNAAA
jgi:hypothetical protein